MALKGDREVLATNPYFRIETGKDAERGTVLIASATDRVAAVPPTTGLTGIGNERPLGVLLNDVENFDFTTTPQVFVRDVVPRGSQVALLKKGRLRTNLIKSESTVPAAGRPAYLAASGWISTAQHAAGSGIRVGHFESAKDADGYADVWFDIEGGK